MTIPNNTDQSNTDSNAKTLSACCHAAVTVGGDDEEGTHYYVCMKCKDICDVGVLDHIYGVKTYTQGIQDALFDPSKHSETEIAERNARIAASNSSDQYITSSAETYYTGDSPIMANSPQLKAGSEELESILDELVYQCTGKRVRTGHHQAGTVPYDELHNAIERINILIAQSSAQAEMRNAESLIKHETYGALNVIDFLTRKGNINNETRLATIEIVSGWESDGLAQLRAQGGDER